MFFDPGARVLYSGLGLRRSAPVADRCAVVKMARGETASAIVALAAACGLTEPQ
jgi:hypothetical protein